LNFTAQIQHSSDDSIARATSARITDFRGNNTGAAVLVISQKLDSPFEIGDVIHGNT